MMKEQGEDDQSFTGHARILPPEPGAPPANLFRVEGPDGKICYAYEFPHPSVAATVVLHDVARKAFLLILRAHEPYRNHYAFPGGFLEVGKESIEETAVRELEEETGVKLSTDALTLVDVRSHPKRDPRDHVFDIAYYAQAENVEAAALDEAAGYRWITANELEDIQLAFDHRLLWERVLNRFL